MLSVTTGLNNLKTKVNDLDVGKLQTVSIDFKKKWCSRWKSCEKHKINTPKTKVNNLGKKTPDATTLININQYNIDKIKFREKNADNEIPDTSGLVATVVLNTKTSGLIKKQTNYDTKIGEIAKKITDHDHSKYINTQEFNKLTAENFKERLKQAKLMSRTDFDNELISFNRKIT